jgi:hypothetical protein
MAAPDKCDDVVVGLIFCNPPIQSYVQLTCTVANARSKLLRKARIKGVVASWCCCILSHAPPVVSVCSGLLPLALPSFSDEKCANPSRVALTGGSTYAPGTFAQIRLVWAAYAAELCHPSFRVCLSHTL